MGLTISHNSALRATRILRANGEDLRLMTNVSIVQPSTWVGKRWSMKEFLSDKWKWDCPRVAHPLHVIVANASHRIRMQNVVCHVQSMDMPSNSYVWLDEFARMSSPEYLFVQMAESLSLPELVLLGHELCGNFTRSAGNPVHGKVIDHVPPATDTDQLRQFIRGAKTTSGVAKARQALDYVSDHAVSVPEAILATIYSLPQAELGYGMGPVRLNQRVQVTDDEDAEQNEDEDDREARTRYPDLLFSFAPIGINYDGENHLDLKGLVESAKAHAIAATGTETALQAEQELKEKLVAVRSKVVDDIRRNRQLASKGKLVFPLTKEDLYGQNKLDNFTRRILSCAHTVFDTDIRPFMRGLDNSALCRERNALLESMLP